MSLAREMSRGFFLKARLGVNGIQNALKSLGTSARWAGLTAAAVFIGSVSSSAIIAADNGGGAPVCPVFRDQSPDSSVKPAPLQLPPARKEALADSEALASESLAGRA